MKKKMSKILAAALALTLALSAAGCGAKKTDEPAQAAAEEVQEEQEEVLDGGWQEAEDGTITEELQALFDKAMESLVGVDYVPVELLATQIVSGTNYKFLCEGTTVVPDGETKQYIVTIYEDLEGNAEVMNIEEVQEEQKEGLVGGWTEAEDGTITEELQALFDKAMEGLVGVDYVPVKLLATQVVAGTNYKFLCEGTTVVPDGETKQYIVTIYEDLEGNAQILEIEEAEGAAN